jgi:hypothetical protein
MYGSSYVSALHRHPQGGFLVYSERRTIEQQSTEYCLVAQCTCTMPLDITPIHNIRLIAPQLSVSQNTLGMLPEDGDVMPKHVGATIHN